jgi:hypothetical protein
MSRAVESVNQEVVVSRQTSLPNNTLLELRSEHRKVPYVSLYISLPILERGKQVLPLDYQQVHVPSRLYQTPAVQWLKKRLATEECPRKVTRISPIANETLACKQLKFPSASLCM